MSATAYAGVPVLQQRLACPLGHRMRVSDELCVRCSTPTTAQSPPSGPVYEYIQAAPLRRRRSDQHESASIRRTESPLGVHLLLMLPVLLVVIAVLTFLVAGVLTVAAYL